MTKEERLARSRQRKAKREERNRRMPYGRLANTKENSGLILEMRQGEEAWIEIRTRGIRVEGGSEWTLIGSISLFGDLKEQAEFIRALVCRYNEQVRDLNATIAEPLKVKEIAQLSEELPC
jgi:hypothetical protein